MITTLKHATLGAASSLVGLAILASQAFAYSEAVISACTDDYLTYCSAYDENSAQGERCMRAVGAKLSKGCINALVASGEFSRTSIGRRTKR